MADTFGHYCLQNSILQVGENIEREVVVEVLFKPEVYVAEVENICTYGFLDPRH